MANVIPAYLPKVVTSTVTALQGDGYMRVKVCYWYNPSTVGDLVVLQDSAGNLIWKGRCETANQSQWVNLPREIEVNGYQVPTIESGELLIYYV